MLEEIARVSKRAQWLVIGAGLILIVVGIFGSIILG
jgi:hypothetical protein